MIVFGSNLEGTASEDSDIDVFVVSEDFAGLTEDQRLDILELTSEGIEPAIHAWGFTPDELEQASELTTLGYAREAGLRFPLTREPQRRQVTVEKYPNSGSLWYLTSGIAKFKPPELIYVGLAWTVQQHIVQGFAL